MQYLILLKVMPIFGYKNKNVKYQKCPISTQRAEKNYSCMLLMPIFLFVNMQICLRCAMVEM